jgi:hypothetical protein
MWILVSIAALVIIGVILLAYAWKGKGKVRHETDYYTLFVMGVIWVIIGAPFVFIYGFEFNALFALGLVFLIAGLANRDKWKKQKKVLTARQKALLSVLLLITVLLVVVTYLFY